MATDADKRIGRAVLIARGEMTQQAVAAEMKRRGWKWSQATVWSIEAGERPLRLAEAEALADILEVAYSQFLATETDAQLWSMARRCSDAQREIIEAVRKFLTAREYLDASLQFARQKAESVPYVLADGGGWLDKDALENTVRRAVAMHEHRNPEDAWFPEIDEPEGGENRG